MDWKRLRSGTGFRYNSNFNSCGIFLSKEMFVSLKTFQTPDGEIGALYSRTKDDHNNSGSNSLHCTISSSKRNRICPQGGGGCGYIFGNEIDSTNAVFPYSANISGPKCCLLRKKCIFLQVNYCFALQWSMQYTKCTTKVWKSTWKPTSTVQKLVHTQNSTTTFPNPESYFEEVIPFGCSGWYGDKSDDEEKRDKTSLHMAGIAAHQIWVECAALQYFLVNSTLHPCTEIVLYCIFVRFSANFA